MKNLFLILPLLSAAAILSAGDPLPVAVEDFARFAPGTYRIKDDMSWTIVEENGKKLLQTKPDTNVLCGWNFLDFRKNHLRLRIRFRMQYGNMILQTKQKNSELLTISNTEVSFNHAAGNKTVRTPDAGLITPGAWTTLEFVFKDNELEAACLPEKGGRRILIQVQQTEQGLIDPKLSFSKPAAVESIESFTPDENLQDLKQEHVK